MSVLHSNTTPPIGQAAWEAAHTVDNGTITAAMLADAYQPLDSDLTAIAALTTTSYGRALLELANAAAARTALALGTLSAQSGTFSGTSSGTNTGDQTLSDATITTTDITTNNVSTSKHGFVPKAPNVATQYLDGTGAYSTPGGDAITGQTGVGGAKISGLQGSPDIVVAGTNDDEFDASGLSGWTVLGSPTHDANTTVKGHYYVTNSATGAGWEGIVKAIPSTTSVFTIAVNDFISTDNYQKCGLVLAESSSGGKMEALELGCPGAPWKLNIETYTSRTSGGGGPVGGAVTAFRPGVYLRAQLLSATSVSYWYSLGGKVWTKLVNAHTPAFTIAYVGIASDTENTGNLQAMLVDWFRVT